MKGSHTAFATACQLGLAALMSFEASGQTAHEGHEHPDIIIDGRSRSVRRMARADAARDDVAGRISTTADNQILVELGPEDTAPANPFDLNGRTLVFTPDGHGGYSRSVHAVAWEEDIGRMVADGAEIELPSFLVDFAGRRWDSFLVSRHGLITFGEPLTYSYWDSENRFDTLSDIAGKFVTTPTISPLYKPMLGGRSDRYGATQYVARRPDRVVVTWITTEPDYYVHGVPPAEPSRFQVVLSADGGITFSYTDVILGDGIVGLFADEAVARGELIGSVVDDVDSDLPGHLDLLEAAIYESTTDAVILEFTTRNPIPEPPAGTLYSYRLYFDTDRPWWTHADFSDLDFAWQIDVKPGGEHTARGHGVIGSMPTDNGNRIALLVDVRDFQGIPATVIADAAQFDDGSFVRGQVSSPTLIRLPTISDGTTDLSQTDPRFTDRQNEVFHYRSAPDSVEIACRVIETLGDEFDLFVFHNEFRVDSQESATPVKAHYGNARKEGLGIEWDSGVPCGEGRLKAVWVLPVWMQSDHVVNHNRHHDERTRFDRGLLLFAHEFTHAWTAYASYASYDRNGEREPLFGNYCRCHWRRDLHAPAAFPWHQGDPGPRSLMGGRFWRENGDGTFTPLDGYWGGGHSWLDLYMMGLAEAGEVPDMFILRNLKPVRAGEPYGPHTGEKEIVSIEQVVAAEGPREPPPAAAQKTFNAAFVYLLEPGRTPDADMLLLHAEYRDKVVEHWHHVTGGRSRMTTVVPSLTAAQSERYRKTWKVLGHSPDDDRREQPAAGSLYGRLARITGFTDHPIEPGRTPVKAIHFRELRQRISALRAREGLPTAQWTDPALTAGVTPARRTHLTELWTALHAVYEAVGQPQPNYTDAAVTEGTTPIEAVHLMQLRAAVVALE